MTFKEMLFGRKKRESSGSALASAPIDAAPPSAHSTGRIGKYDIVEKIGAGGFGTVYKGWDPLIQRYVAIKTCEVGNKDIRNRFFREAQLAGSLQHPNITMVYEFGFEKDIPYMVQEFLSGEDLDQMIKRGAPLSLQEKLKILIGVAFGLEYAHRAGVMHRDVKPANVRVLDNLSVKIMDFGIAKSVDPAVEITQTGITVGSSSYMSPEQIGGDAVDSRTDIFSFGVLAYELISSRKPFQNENLFLLLEQIVKEDPPPLAELVPDLPDGLVALVERAMKKKPEDRFATARELRDALIAVQQQIAPAEALVSSAMGEPPPHDEWGRLQALKQLDILDTEPEREFDDLTFLASQVCGTPIALLSFVDRDREWFKSEIGVSFHQVPRAVSLGVHAIREPRAVVVADPKSDDRFAESPLVVSEPKLRFYAAAPLTTPDGFVVGTLSAADRVPRELSPAQIEGLQALARQVMAQLELRRRRRSDREQSSEKLILEAAGLSDDRPHPASEDVQ
ncbi:MAG TPA: GAF domain-containing serine/threonine-protein kinase [Thermoanaerobaculia bacterium]|nr:GAF domain-containing serine/threonine-protein kinase [Thermoanaerobaculia bacterium]